ncbi:MAG: hypothetical protein AAGA19_16070 [Pseudomonadota bacterium]
MFKALVPRIGKHCLRDLKQALCRRQVLQDGLKVAFELVAAYGLAFALAAFGGAQIVGMLFSGFGF